MTSIRYFWECTILGRCINHVSPVAETKRLLKETAAEWEPIKAQIAREERSRTDLARMLAEVRLRHERGHNDG